jgi:hypothetical protein
MYGSITSRHQDLPQGAGAVLSATRRPSGAHLNAAWLLYARQPTAVDLDREAPHYFILLLRPPPPPSSCICLMNPINQVAFACFILRISCCPFACSLSRLYFFYWCDSGPRTKPHRGTKAQAPFFFLRCGVFCGNSSTLLGVPSNFKTIVCLFHHIEHRLVPFTSLVSCDWTKE